MDWKEFDRLGLGDELGNVFGNPKTAQSLLLEIGFPPAQIPLPDMAADGFWPRVLGLLRAGVVDNAPTLLVQEAARRFPGNKVFAAALPIAESIPQGRRSGFSILVTGEADPSSVLERSREIATDHGLDSPIEFGAVTEDLAQLKLERATSEETLELARVLKQEGLVDRIECMPNEFTDYLYRRLFVEGTDPTRYDLDDIPASTRIKDVARAVTEEYSRSWPDTHEGRPRRAIVDRIDERTDWREQLEAERTLHTGTLREDETLNTAPEATAGDPSLALELHTSTKNTAGGGSGGTGTPAGPAGPPPPPSRGWEATDATPQNRFLQGWLPETIKLGHRIPLLVRITLHGGDEDTTPLRSLPIPVRGTDIQLFVSARKLKIEHWPTRTVTVTPDRDSEWVVFELTAEQEGTDTVQISAFHGASYLGTLLLPVAIGSTVSTGSHSKSFGQIGSRSREQGEVTLLVHYSPEQMIYRYQLIDSTIGCSEVIYSRKLLQTPEQRVAQIVKDLNHLARGDTGYSPKQARIYLKNLGIDLWREFVPRELQDLLWERQPIRRLFILSDGDLLPWELMYPAHSEAPDDCGFLADQFPIARWPYGQPPTSQISFRNAGLVLPAGSPDSATVEIKGLRHLLERQQVGVESTISELDHLLSTLDDASINLLHFACHNTFSPESPSMSTIKMGEVSFKPTFLNQHEGRLGEVAPLVFMNACRSDGKASESTRLTGWADRFVRARAGAFVGSQWEVRDTSANLMANVFYRSLVNGKMSLGEALMKARETIRDEPADPTWLSYTFYGDPAARLRVEEPEEAS